jgi:hypothetical protein
LPPGPWVYDGITVRHRYLHLTQYRYDDFYSFGSTTSRAPGAPEMTTSSQTGRSSRSRRRHTCMSCTWCIRAMRPGVRSPVHPRTRCILAYDSHRKGAHEFVANFVLNFADNSTQQLQCTSPIPVLPCLASVLLGC